MLPDADMTAWTTAGHRVLKGGSTGLPGYSTSHHVFRADGLKSILAASFATRGGVVVLSVGKAYFLRAAEPAGFMVDLTQRGVKLRET